MKGAFLIFILVLGVWGAFELCRACLNSLNEGDEE